MEPCSDGAGQRQPRPGGVTGVIDRKRRGSVAGMATSIYVATALGFVTGPIVGRALGPSGRGEVASAVIYGLLADIVLTMGVPFAIGHAAARNPRLQRALLGAAVRQATFLGPVGLALATLVVQYPLRDASTPARIGAFVLVALGPLDFVTTCQRMILQARGDLRPLARLRFAPIALSALATVTLGVTGTLTVGTYLVTQIGAGMFVNLASWWSLPVRPQGAVPMKPLLGFGLRGIGASLGSFGTRQIDQVFLVSAVASRQLGLYVVAVTIANLPLGFGQAIGARAFGETGRDSERDEWDTAARYLRIALVSGMTMSVLIAVTMPVILPLLYGSAFKGAVVPMLLLLPGTAAFAYSATSNQMLVSVGRPGANTLAELVGLGVTIPGLLVAVPVAGIKGAAVVSSVAYICRAIAHTVALRGAGVGSVRPRPADVVTLVRGIGSSVQRKNPLRRQARRGMRATRQAARAADGRPAALGEE